MSGGAIPYGALAKWVQIKQWEDVGIFPYGAPVK